jgi:hypothetical protein
LPLRVGRQRDIEGFSRGLGAVRPSHQRRDGHRQKNCQDRRSERFHRRILPV